jgi:signal transduction histidine kinase
VLHSDPEIIQFVNRNLIQNAVKHSFEGGRIEINSEIKNNEVIISVADNGPGIDPALANEIFQSFRDTSTPRKGAGMALVICRELLALLNGHIWVENTGRGTTFFYALPVNK